MNLSRLGLDTDYLNSSPWSGSFSLFYNIVKVRAKLISQKNRQQNLKIRQLEIGGEGI